GVVNILTGESGVGKTTLCELILGLYEIENGYIKLNKTNIKDINKINWWSYVSYCSQVPFFFSFTLEEN
ncbi:ATP-binding cassette domain-containing protein, partial [Acinetobacter baumannii]|nr:ATP-binding cassette domain-containing protein [Acinetobacter baumannii]